MIINYKQKALARIKSDFDNMMSSSIGDVGSAVRIAMIGRCYRALIKGTGGLIFLSLSPIFIASSVDEVEVSPLTEYH